MLEVGRVFFVLLTVILAAYAATAANRSSGWLPSTRFYAVFIFSNHRRFSGH